MVARRDNPCFWILVLYVIVSGYRRGVDVLSDVIAVMRTGEPVSARVVWHAPWGQRFAPVPGAAGFQVVLQGTCWLAAPDVDPIPLSVGDVVFFPHGRGHTLADSLTTPITAEACDPNDPHFPEPESRDGPTTVTACGAYQLDPARAHPLLLSLPELVHVPARVGHRPELRAAIDLLSVELERPRLGSDALVPALLDTLLLYILRAWFEQQPTSVTSGWAAALNDPPVTAALHAIHRAPGHPWTVAKLAAEGGLSRAPFARRFNALVGLPPLTYLTWWRMIIAGRLLRDSDLSLAVVAGRVGYSSEFAFSAAFKRRYGVAPGRYRRGL
jgi:AraC-like DNA-binding protein